MLTNDEFTRRDCIHGNPRLEACLEIATKSHEGQFRRNKKQPYIVHPRLLCNLVQAFGGTDVQKAVALLHDVVEDNIEKYKRDPQLLKADLLTELYNKCPPVTTAESDEIAIWATRVVAGVEQLSLGEYRVHGSKRATQVDAVKHIDEEWRQVKILDQAASVIDDILNSDPHNEDGLKQRRFFALKGWDVSLKCSGDDIASASPYFDFYNRVFNHYREYYKNARAQHWEKAQAIRDSFNIEATITDALNPAIKAPIKAELGVDEYFAPFLKTSAAPADKTAKKPIGLAYVNLSKVTGRVVSFGLAVSPNKPDDSPDNRIAADMREALESRMTVGVATGDLKDERAHPGNLIDYLLDLKERILEQHNGAVQVRNYKVYAPLSLARLVNVAKAKGGIDHRFEMELRRKVAEQHRERAGRS